ncbi:hypothetical protein ACH4FX_42635 [Streptomyces sp. NPDC018019]|uniref:MmyB family transcriptional regulator n=1 Tax=Streptomyces sp. NPDC018019 TaxID=3365030 RepID=UPI003791D483
MRHATGTCCDGTSPASRHASPPPRKDAAFESADAADAADLRAAAGRQPGDPLLRDLIAGLRRASPRFESLWQERAVARHASGRKTILPPGWPPDSRLRCPHCRGQ